METGQAQILWAFSVAGDVELMYTGLGVDSATFVSGDEQALVDGAYAAWADWLLTVQSSSCALEAAYLQLQTALGVSEWSHVEATAGGGFAAALPSNCAYLVRKNTAAAGRGKSGRMYVPGALEAQVTPAGIVDPAELASWNGAHLTAFYSAFTSDVGDPVVNHQAGSPLGSTSTVTSFTMDSKIATQRRRLRP